MERDGACVILYFYTATRSLKGHGSGLLLPRGNCGIVHDQFLSQIEITRATLLLLPIIYQTKEKEVNKRKPTKEKTASSLSQKETAKEITPLAGPVPFPPLYPRIQPQRSRGSFLLALMHPSLVSLKRGLLLP